jgi:hypothetical protein
MTYTEPYRNIPVVKIFITAANNTISGTIHHEKAHGRIDEGISQKLNLRTET